MTAERFQPSAGVRLLGKVLCGARHRLLSGGTEELRGKGVPEGWRDNGAWQSGDFCTQTGHVHYVLGGPSAAVSVTGCSCTQSGPGKKPRLIAGRPSAPGNVGPHVRDVFLGPRISTGR